MRMNLIPFISLTHAGDGDPALATALDIEDTPRFAEASESPQFLHLFDPAAFLGS